ncbi:MAG: zinc ribbon domain-containing protein [Eubacteriales bacterium]|nr:zinc ribbon domain-containing protein [Eubacteriales bacterium]
MKNSYGFDRLSRDMLFFAVILDIFALLFFGQVAGLILCSASAIIAACTLFRILSTNVNKRTSELRGYEIILGSIRSFFQKLFNRSKNDAKKHAAYKYFRCPNCKQKLRAPRGKGRIRVTCSSCGTQFQKRT